MDVVVVGENHSNTLNVIRSLGRNGFSVTLLLVSEKNSFVSYSKYITKEKAFSSIDSIVTVLLDLQFECKVPVFTCSDRCALEIDRHFDELSSRYYIQSCEGKQSALFHWMSKDSMLSCAKSVGFNAPKTICLQLSDVLQLTDITFPCLVKPNISALGNKHDFCICKNTDELKNALSSYDKNVSSVLIQDFLKKDYEQLIIGICDQSSGFHVIPGAINKLKTCQSHFDMGMNCYAFLSKDNLSNEIENKVKLFINKISYDGIYSIELMVSNGKPYFLEVNLRTDGCLYIYDGGGVSLPSIWANAKYKLALGTQSLCKPRVYGMTEISYLKYMDWRNPFNFFKDLLKTDCFNIFAWDDLLPFVMKFIYP